MSLSDDCKVKLVRILETVISEKNFGDGRFIDKLFDAIIMQHACNTLDTEDKEKLITVTIDDIKDDVLEQILYKKGAQKKIGF